ncbi:amino acid adenylation domain-containing protein [Nocardia sp. NPDC051030]|uniref:amino acid adenylation domain-containing protein n=1 Tax=Nocardia sp. NPDC051030 TaxID=3155162 RepID=UPI00344AB988
MANQESDHALYQRFLRSVRSVPERHAVRDGDRACTYAELHERALNRAGAVLAAADRPKVVGVLADRSIETYAGLLAALYAGATVVPLHPDFPAQRTERMLTDASVELVLADERGRKVLSDIGSPDVKVIELEDAGGPGLSEPRPVRASDVAYMLFTSGSTGRPKGVPITHANARHYFELMDARYDFTPEDVFSQTFDLNFDCAMFDLFCAWGAGATVQTVPPAAYRDLPRFVAERGMTVWFATPSSIVLARKRGGLTPGALPTLRWSLFAGEALRAADVTDWQAAAPGSTIENIYGPTELTITITGHRWRSDASPGLCVNGLVPIGAVHAGHDWILRTESGDTVGDEGELCISGPQMTAGYLDPTDDIGRFLDHDGRRWYRTGDRVRVLGNGELIYLGRLDSQVQVQGWRVELAEVEHALRSCPTVDDAVVVTRSVAGVTELVVFHTGSPTEASTLYGSLRRVLPAGMLPREFRYLEEFPLNGNRKIDRGRLAREAAQE